MDKEKFEKLGPLYGHLGAEGAAITGGGPDGLFIFLEVEEGSVYGAVFKDEGDVLRYYDPSRALCDLALEAWEAEPEGKRWLVMEYVVHDFKFDVHLTYPEEVSPKESAPDRRRAALDSRYPGKTVLYPPMPEHFEPLG